MDWYCKSTGCRISKLNLLTSPDLFAVEPLPLSQTSSLFVHSMSESSVIYIIHNVCQLCLAPAHCGTPSETSEEKRREVKKDKSEPQLSSQCDPRAVSLMDPRVDLLPQLLDFDEAQRQRAFDSKVFCCGICFVEKLGSSCVCFKDCQHVYCKACMTEYFQIQIRDGNVQCLNCPEPKCNSLATPLQVRER